MTADIINLRRARKVRARAADREKAAENRVKHGLPRSERTRAERERALERARHEGHKTADHTNDD
jgi:hypothetical protein